MYVKPAASAAHWYGGSGEGVSGSGVQLPASVHACVRRQAPVVLPWLGWAEGVGGGVGDLPTATWLLASPAASVH